MRYMNFDYADEEDWTEEEYLKYHYGRSYKDMNNWGYKLVDFSTCLEKEVVIFKNNEKDKVIEELERQKVLLVDSRLVKNSKGQFTTKDLVRLRVTDWQDKDIIWWTAGKCWND